MNKLLITGGCSYSQVPNTDLTWPLHLQNTSAFRFVSHTGHGSAGNALISRKVIARVLEAERAGFSTRDMVVGVIWSGCDRMTHYSENLEHTYPKSTPLGYGRNIKDLKDNIINRPRPAPFIDLKAMQEEMKTGFDSVADFLAMINQESNNSNPLAIGDSENFSHWTMNCHWNDQLTSTYYEHFVNPQKAIIETCEHILRTEWFLKSKGINYFFSEYDTDVFHYYGPHGYGHNRSDHPGHEFTPAGDPFGGIFSANSECIQWPNEYTVEVDNQHLTNPDIKYLYNAIDRDYFLPVKSLQDWVTNVSPFKHRDLKPDGMPRDPHPSTAQHKDFTERVILPFLLEKYNIA